MKLPPVTIIEPVGALSPLVVDSPHSGRDYPDDFNFTCPLHLLRQTEDFLVDELIAGAVDAGGTIVAANFPRSFIDANRAENDIDPAVLAEAWDVPLVLTERTALGLGLVRRLCMTGVPLYAAPLPVREVKHRIENFYRPYHAALSAALEKRMSFFGSACLLNCHSMPSRSHEEGGAPRPDFILGDRNGTSCDPSVTRKVTDHLHDMGYSVALNNPYKGMEIAKRYGRPQAAQQALQIEVNRRLYMDEARHEKHGGFDALRQNLTRLFAALAADLAETQPEQLAAE